MACLFIRRTRFGDRHAHPFGGVQAEDDEFRFPFVAHMVGDRKHLRELESTYAPRCVGRALDDFLNRRTLTSVRYILGIFPKSSEE